MEGQVAGVLAVLAGGVFQGSFMLPMKWTRRWEWENTWLIFACTAYLLCPWLIVFATMPQIVQIYAASDVRSILTVLLFGVGWGIGAVTFGLGVEAVGLALGFAVILGLAACFGTLVPLLVLPQPGFSLARSIVMGAALCSMLAGVAVCSFAGKWKEKGPREKSALSYKSGLLMCVVSGVLSSCGNLGYVFGSDIIRNAQAMGVSIYLAPNAVWALLTLALFTANAGYAILLLRRNHSAARFRERGTVKYFIYGALMGLLWMGGFVFYGAGTQRLGKLGPSLGWSILMSVMVLTSNILGLATGEWTGAPTPAKRQLKVGILCLLLAIGGLGYANRMP